MRVLKLGLFIFLTTSLSGCTPGFLKVRVFIRNLSDTPKVIKVLYESPAPNRITFYDISFEHYVNNQDYRKTPSVNQNRYNNKLELETINDSIYEFSIPSHSTVLVPRVFYTSVLGKGKYLNKEGWLKSTHQNVVIEKQEGDEYIKLENLKYKRVWFNTNVRYKVWYDITD